MESEAVDKVARRAELRRDIDLIEDNIKALKHSKNFPGVQEKIEDMQAELDALKQIEADLE